jgi:osmotically inducible lipoprotein OsmB
MIDMTVAATLPVSPIQDKIMNRFNAMQKYALTAVVAAMLLGLAACSGMSAQDKNTAIGAGVGAVGGAVLTDGSALGTVGGAAVGGVIGHEINKDD